MSKEELMADVAAFLTELLDMATYNWGDLDHTQVVPYNNIEDGVEEFALSIGLPKPTKTNTHTE